MSVLNTVLHSSIVKSRGKLVMAAVKSNSLYAWLTANGRIEFESGGHEITNPLITGRNPNVTSMEYYDELPVAQTDEFTTIRYNWSRVVGTVIISDQEEDENQGETAIFKLMKAKIDVLEESIKEKFSDWLYGAGTGADPYGLPNLIADDPTTGSLGGISRATESAWRTSAYDFDGTLDDTNIEEAFDDIMLDLTQKTEKPNLILAGRNIYRTYRAAVRSKFTITLDAAGGSGKTMFDLGFEGVKFNGATILYDEQCPVNQAYFINDKYLRLHVLRHVNMKVKELSAPWNVDAKGRRVQWQGQLCLWKAYRTHATLLN